ncbi:MAG: glycosyltransferase family 39 protein [Verrucomicrobium sp.]|nr:glycosyltransferase family 39 protein [Verrucomicrobium sp.]
MQLQIWPLMQVPSLSPRAHVWLLVAAGILLLVLGSAELPLIDRDEPRFAEATREMLQRHSWLVPTFNGHERFDKPPLTYWVMSVFYQLGGVTELMARLHSILSAIVLALFLYATGARWFTAAAGFVAGFAFLTSFQVLLHGRLSVADMPMVLAVAVAQVALFDLLDTAENGTRKRLLLYGSLAVGFLAKGPITLAVPVVTALLYRFVFWRRPLPWRNLRLVRGLLGLLALTALWGVPCLLVTDGRWWHVGIGEHVVARGMEPLNSRHYFLPYYLVTSLLSFFPWIAFAGAAAVAARRHWNARNAFLVAWLVAPYLIFTAYATQLPHYILPAFPAFFLLLAQAPGLHGPLPRWARVFAGGVLALWGIILLALGAVIVAAPWTPELRHLRAALLGLWTVLGGLMFLALLWRGNLFRLAWVPVLAVSAGFLILGTSLRPLLPALAVAEASATLPADAACLAYGFTEGSLIFYTGRRWAFPENPAALNGPGPLLSVALEREIGIGPALEAIWKRREPKVRVLPPVLTGPVREASGIDFARASWVTIAYSVKE